MITCLYITTRPREPRGDCAKNGLCWNYLYWIFHWINIYGTDLSNRSVPYIFLLSYLLGYITYSFDRFQATKWGMYIHTQYVYIPFSEIGYVKGMYSHQRYVKRYHVPCKFKTKNAQNVFDKCWVNSKSLRTYGMLKVCIYGKIGMYRVSILTI